MELLPKLEWNKHNRQCLSSPDTPLCLDMTPCCSACKRSIVTGTSNRLPNRPLLTSKFATVWNFSEVDRIPQRSLMVMITKANREDGSHRERLWNDLHMPQSSQLTGPLTLCGNIWSHHPVDVAEQFMAASSWLWIGISFSLSYVGRKTMFPYECQCLDVMLPHWLYVVLSIYYAIISYVFYSFMTLLFPDVSWQWNIVQKEIHNLQTCDVTSVWNHIHLVW